MGGIGGYCTTAFVNAIKESGGDTWSRQVMGINCAAKWKKKKADMQDRGREATGEAFTVQVSDPPSKLGQVPPPWWFFGGEQQQPICLFWCSMGNPWLWQQTTTGQGVLGGIVRSGPAECLRAGWKRDRDLPTEDCKTGSGCRRTSRPSNKARPEDTPGVCGRDREAIANSGACQETTVPKECCLCCMSTAPRLDSEFCLSLVWCLTSKERKDATGKASAAL